MKRNFVFNFLILLILIVVPLTTIVNWIWVLVPIPVIITILLLLRNLKYGLYFFALTYPIVSFIKRGLIIPGLALNEVLLLLVTVVFVFNIFIGKYRLRRNFLLVEFAIYFFCAAFLPLVVSIFKKELLDLNIILQYCAAIQYYLILVLFHNILEEKRDRKILLYYLLAGSLIVSIIGIFQWFDILGMRNIIDNLFTTQWRWEEYIASELDHFRKMRVTSTLNNWNGCGAYLAVLVCVGFLLYIINRNLKFHLLLSGVIILNIVCLILTFSFTSYIILIVIASTSFFIMRKFKLIVYLLFIFVLLLIVMAPLFEQRIQEQFRGDSWVPHSLQYRLRLWDEQMIPLIKENIVFGMGPDYYQLPNVADSQYIFLFLRGGIFLFIAFFILFFKMIFIALRNIKIADDNFTKYSGILVFSLLVGIFVGNFTEPYFRYAGVAELIWILLAISYPIQTVGNGRDRSLQKPDERKNELI